MASDLVGSAVVVHGAWGNPGDWEWVRRLLEREGVQVLAPDLPSHRSTTAGTKEDANEVRNAIRAAQRPVVVVGWSYGGSIISTAADGEDVRHLIYVGDIPVPAQQADNSLAWTEENPHVLVRRDGTFVLDNDWWLDHGDGTTFSPEIQDHLRRNPRRPVSKGYAHRQEGAAWTTIPTTIILGVDDSFFTEGDIGKATNDFDDVQIIDSDHFIVWRQPEVVAGAVLKALGLTSSSEDAAARR